VRFAAAPAAGAMVVFNASEEVSDDRDARCGDVPRDGIVSAVAPVSRATVFMSPLEALRRATAESHLRLEAMSGQTRLLAPDFTLAEYRCALERMYGFYEPLGRALSAHEHATTWGARVAQRADLLRCDLLGLGSTAADVDGLARCTQLPLPDTPDRALGCAYVFEGSTLGGRVIFKHLARVFPQRADVPLSFFAGDGERTGDNWRCFCAALNGAAANVDEVCAAACSAFDAMAAWLGEPASTGTAETRV
jgi:heme oxygenase